MKLWRLGRIQWTVLAALDNRGECPVIQLLNDSGAPGERMLADLLESIPQRGPPMRNLEVSKHLRDKIYEFRESVTRGGTLRLLWFYDEGRVVVCTNGVLKKGDKTPDGLIDAAIEIRKAYFVSKFNKSLDIVDAPFLCLGDDDV
jgi:hypothetical protein